MYVTAKLSLEGYSPHNLRYLQCGDTRQDEAEDAARFQAWKACLGTHYISVQYVKSRKKFHTESQGFIIPELSVLNSCTAETESPNLVLTATDFTVMYINE